MLLISARFTALNPDKNVSASLRLRWIFTFVKSSPSSRREADSIVPDGAFADAVQALQDAQKLFLSTYCRHVHGCVCASLPGMPLHPSHDKHRSVIGKTKIYLFSLLFLETISIEKQNGADRIKSQQFWCAPTGLETKSYWAEYSLEYSANTQQTFIQA